MPATTQRAENGLPAQHGTFGVMATVRGFDVHRAQITFVVVTPTRDVTCGRIEAPPAAVGALGGTV
jgi:hypothetical protein